MLWTFQVLFSMRNVGTRSALFGFASGAQIIYVLPRCIVLLRNLLNMPWCSNMHRDKSAYVLCVRSRPKRRVVEIIANWTAIQLFGVFSISFIQDFVCSCLRNGLARSFPSCSAFASRRWDFCVLDSTVQIVYIWFDILDFCLIFQLQNMN